MVQGWDAGADQFPRAPANVHVSSPYQIGSYDIHWDNPAIQWANAPFTVVGVNIYRSDVSDRGPYHRINLYPLSSTFYRDATQFVPIQDEIITPDRWIYQGDAPNNRRFLLRTLNPIVIKDQGPHQHPVYGNSPRNVYLKINGVPVEVDSIFGSRGEITLINVPTTDPATDLCVNALLPTDPSDVVEVSYLTHRNFIHSGLDAKIHYRVTTVVLDPSTPSGLAETPLDYAEPHHNVEVEVVDYIWREGIRRNNWILEQGGERVKVFIRRQNGIPCNCPDFVHAKSIELAQQPSNRCLICYGTGFCGGYEGPFDVIMAPDDAEHKISQQLQGRRMEHVYEVWMGPSPLVTQRDFVVKQTNERYSIGPVRKPSNRGNVLQQHFQIGYLDEQDIRYQVPLDSPLLLPWPESRRTDVPPISYPGRQPQPGYVAWLDADGNMVPPYTEGANPVSPMATEKSNIPDDRELRGRSKVWENINY